MANRTLKSAGGAKFNQSWYHKRRLVEWVGCLDEVVGWYCGRTMTGISLNKGEDGWLLVLRAKNGRGAEVAFAHGSTPHEALGQLAASIKAGCLRWRPDRYAEEG